MVWKTEHCASAIGSQQIFSEQCEYLEEVKLVILKINIWITDQLLHG